MLKHLWHEKRDKYLATGWWKYHIGGNAIPMLRVHKKPGPDGQICLCTMFDNCEHNTKDAITGIIPISLHTMVLLCGWSIMQLLVWQRDYYCGLTGVENESYSLFF